MKTHYLIPFLFTLVLLFISCQTEPTDSPKAVEDSMLLPDTIQAGAGTIIIHDPAFKTLIDLEAKMTQLASGHRFTEGPLWESSSQKLYYSDIPNNQIYQWEKGKESSVFLEYSGMDKGIEYPDGLGIGSNGLTFDLEGRMILCQHGNRKLARLEEDGSTTILAESYEGKRFNSPNDAVVHSNGAIYFTDPPYGIAGEDESPDKELSFNGVYRWTPDGLTLLDSTLTRPNGIALDPSEQVLYVAVSDPKSKYLMRYEVQADGTLSNRSLFADLTTEVQAGLPDGMKIDTKGNIWLTGPGGVWVYQPDGKLLGRICPKEVPANCAFGGENGSDFYMTAQTGLYHIPTLAKGTKLN